MPTQSARSRKLVRKRTRSPQAEVPIDQRVRDVVAWLERTGSAKGRAGMARYAIPSDRAFGVSVGALRAYAKRLGPSHALALALWKTGWYEARMLAVFVGEPAALTPAQMDRWCDEFDNWAICDTACFALFDRTPHAWGRIPVWARGREEFVRRGAFALLWGLSVHDRTTADERFLRALPLIEKGARDERHYVARAVDMALRAVGKRNAVLNAAAIETAERLAASDDAAPRWVGRHALGELTGPSVRVRLAARRRLAS